MKSRLHQLETEYISALQDYLASPAEATLTRAYEIGRAALAQELGLLEMAVLHHEALGRILPLVLGLEESTQVVKEAKSFFVESLTPFEMVHRGFRDANSALRRLNEKLEEEAKRIAHSLHDEAGQFLACVHIALDEVGRELPPRFRKRLREIRGLLDQVEGQLRRLSHELRPTILDDLGLLPALEFLAEGVSKRAALPITVEGRRNGRLPSAIETILYRVVQEALTNVSKHAQATHASVQIQRQPGSILCSIRDDGVGFDVPVVMKKKGQRGLGLMGIRERVAVLGGTLQIHSEPGHGTEMLITVPLEV
jgi:two-component system sensor histidine kinase UhpB